MRHLQRSERHELRKVSTWGLGVLVVLSAFMLSGQAHAATCNSELDLRLSGPGVPGDPIFLGDDVRATMRIRAVDIQQGNYVDVPNFGFAADCQKNEGLIGLTYDNCKGQGNGINYLGDIVVGANCVSADGSPITFDLTQSTFIDFFPDNPPIRIQENESCTISWEFEVDSLNDPDGQPPAPQEATIFQVVSFPLSEAALDGDDQPFAPAMCDNGRLTSEDRTTVLSVDTCDVDVEKQICDPNAEGGCGEDSQNWKDADTAPGLLLTTPGQAVYRAIVSNTGTADFVGTIRLDDDDLGISNFTVDWNPDNDGKMVIGGETITDLNNTCRSEEDPFENTLQVEAWCRRGAGADYSVIAEDKAYGDCREYRKAPKLVLEKTASPEEFTSQGDEIEYSYKLTNAGDVTLWAPFTVDDDKINQNNAGGDVEVDCPDSGSIDTGEFVLCDATYVITDADVEAGLVTNYATATAKDAETGGNDVVSNEDDETVTSRNVSIDLKATEECINDVPWVCYSVTSTGIDNLQPSQVTYSWLNLDSPGNPVVVETGQLASLESCILWPGAAATGAYPAAIGDTWPGWTEDPDGVWTFNDTDQVPNLTFRISVNPTDEVALVYPDVDDTCAPPPVITVDKSSDVTENEDGTVDIKYTVKVENTGGQSGTYNLVDTLDLDGTLELESIVSNVSYAGGTDSLLQTPEQPTEAQFLAGATLIKDETLASGMHESFEFTLSFGLFGSETTVEGANCLPGDDDDDDTGLNNKAEVLVGGKVVDFSDVCDPFPVNPEIDLIKEIWDEVKEEWSHLGGPVGPSSGAVYRMRVANTGNVNLTTVTISDPVISDVLAENTYVFSNLGVDAGYVVISTLEGPEGAWTYLDVAQVCEGTGNEDNIAMAIGEWGGEPPAKDDDTATLICVGDPELSIIKQVKVCEKVNGEPSWCGWQNADTQADYPRVVYDPTKPVTAEYRLIIKNEGDVDLVNVVVDDEDDTGLLFEDVKVGDGILAPGAEKTLTSADIPELRNENVCTGTGPFSNVAGVEGTDVNEPASDAKRATDVAGVMCVDKPAIKIVKETSFLNDSDEYANSVTAKVPSNGYWRFIISNEGGVDLENVVVEDYDQSNPGTLVFNQKVIDLLRVGETVTIQYDSATEPDKFPGLYAFGFCDAEFDDPYVNVATVTGDPVLGGSSVSSTDTATYNCVDERKGDICYATDGTYLGKPDSVRLIYEPNEPTVIADGGTTPIIINYGSFPVGDVAVDIYVFDNRGGKRNLLPLAQGGVNTNITPDTPFEFSGDKSGVAPTVLLEIYGDCEDVTDSTNCDESSLIQTVEFHTSCSQVITSGDRYGAIYIQKATHN